MSETLRRRLGLGGVPLAPLTGLREVVEEHGRPGGEDLRALADGLGMPVAPLRGAMSSYADLTRQSAEELRVCRGTSCTLAGADRLFAGLEGRAACRGVYCLGYCDRSPAVLRWDDQVLFPAAAADPEEVIGARRRALAPPSVRCVARERIVTRRLGRGGFASLAAARADGAWETLPVALGGAPEAVLDAVERSGERGRGGAGFSTGGKWRMAARAEGPRYVVANGDEGDPGSFVDRALMEEDPHGVLEGMALCAYAVGAGEGIVYVRSEYPAARAALAAAVREAREAGLLGPSVGGSGFAFEVSVVSGLGSYVCGEETALLNALEGGRGEVRLRPPYPTRAGLHGRPTVVNNVETLVNIPWIAANGAEAYAALGTAASPGTKALCLNHGFARSGIVEVEFGLDLRTAVEALGGGGALGRRLRAVLMGGPMGSVLTPDDWDVPICYEAMGARGLRLGHGGLVALPEDADLAALVRHWLAFMADESCGKCTPCRLGSRRAVELAAGDPSGARPDLERLLRIVEEASLCGFGQGIPGPVLRLLELMDEDPR